MTAPIGYVVARDLGDGRVEWWEGRPDGTAVLHPTAEEAASERDRITSDVAGRAGPAAMLAEFHQALGQSFGDGGESNELRATLIREEAREACDELIADNRVGVAQELADVVYVAYGTAFSHGIDLDAVLAEVHRANMAKFGPDGSFTVREDGKLLKPDGWRPPDIAAVLDTAPDDDMFGTTCTECLAPLDDDHPYGTNEDGDFVHYACADDAPAARPTSPAQPPAAAPIAWLEPSGVLFYDTDCITRLALPGEKQSSAALPLCRDEAGEEAGRLRAVAAAVWSELESWPGAPENAPPDVDIPAVIARLRSEASALRDAGNALAQAARRYAGFGGSAHHRYLLDEVTTWRSAAGTPTTEGEAR